MPLEKPDGLSGMLTQFAIPEAVVWAAAERFVHDDLDTKEGRERAFTRCYADIREAWRQSESRLISSVARAVVDTSPFWQDFDNDLDALDEAWDAFKSTEGSKELLTAGSYLLHQGRELGRGLRHNAAHALPAELHASLVFSPPKLSVVDERDAVADTTLGRTTKDFLHSVVVSVKCCTPSLPHTVHLLAGQIPLRLLAVASAVQLHQLTRGGESMNHESLRRDMRGFGRVWEYRRRVLGDKEEAVDDAIILHMASLSTRVDPFTANPRLDTDSDDVFEDAPARPTSTLLLPPRDVMLGGAMGAVPAPTPATIAALPAPVAPPPQTLPTQAAYDPTAMIASMTAQNDDDDDAFNTEHPP